jgi:hypothetical protein
MSFYRVQRQPTHVSHYINERDIKMEKSKKSTGGYTGSTANKNISNDTSYINPNYSGSTINSKTNIKGYPSAAPDVSKAITPNVSKVNPPSTASKVEVPNVSKAPTTTAPTYPSKTEKPTTGGTREPININFDFNLIMPQREKRKRGDPGYGYKNRNCRCK